MILGVDHVLFGVSDVVRCADWLASFGLGEVATDRHGRRFAATDGSALVLCDGSMPHLPPAPAAQETCRAVRFAVADRYALDAIGDWLCRDRHVACGPDGSLHTVDDAGFNIGFRCDRDAVVWCRREQGAHARFARTLTQITYRVPDVDSARRFYVERLGLFACGTHLLRLPACSTTILLLQGALGCPRVERVAFAPYDTRAGDLQSPLGCAVSWAAHAAAAPVLEAQLAMPCAVTC